MTKRGSRTIDIDHVPVRITAGYENDEFVGLDIDGENVLILSSDEAMRIGVALQCAAMDSLLGWTPDDEEDGS